MNVNTQPNPGDVVVDDEQNRYVITGSYFGIDFDDGKGPMVLAIRGSAYRNGNTVSVSGGPCPFVPIAKLVPAGTTEQRFWKFKNDVWRAHNGEDYTMTVQMFNWNRGNDDK